MRAASLRCSDARGGRLTGSISLSDFTRATRWQRTESRTLPQLFLRSPRSQPAHRIFGSYALAQTCAPYPVLSWASVIEDSSGLEMQSVKLMDGREVSRFLKPHLLAHAHELADRHRFVPALAAILVGDNAASTQYVRNKRKFTEDLGFRSEIITVAAAEATTDRLLETI